MYKSSNAQSNVIAFPSNERAMATIHKATIVVPCYNEAARLNDQAFLDYLASAPSVSFIFVNDGSSDSTLMRLIALRNRAPSRITVLDLHRNGGKHEAVRQGLLLACGSGVDFVGYIDADLATPLYAIDDFIRCATLLPETQVVFGSRRALLGHRIERTLARRTVSRLCALLARQAVRLPVGDTQCGVKLLRNSRNLRAALVEPFEAGWLFDVELFARLAARYEAPRRAFFEHPLPEWTEIPGSHIDTRAIVRSGFTMLRLIARTRLAASATKKTGTVRAPRLDGRVYSGRTPTLEVA